MSDGGGLSRNRECRRVLDVLDYITYERFQEDYNQQHADSQIMTFVSFMMYVFIALQFENR